MSWELKDKYSRVVADQITTRGIATGYSMVYGENDKGELVPIRPVSDVYTPVSTEVIVDSVKKSLNCEVVEQVHLDCFGTKVQVDLVPVKGGFDSGYGLYDRNTEWTSRGTLDKRSKKDLLRPSIRIINGYAGNSSVKIGMVIMRMVCLNGMMMPQFTMLEQVIHYEAKVVDLRSRVEQVRSYLPEAENKIGLLVGYILSAGQVEVLSGIFPKLKDKFVHYMSLDNGGVSALSAYRAVNFFSFVQSHEVSINRAKAYQKVVDAVCWQAECPASDRITNLLGNNELIEENHS